MSKFKIHYAWVVLVACFLCCFSYGVFYTFGVFLRHLQLEFGWGRGLASTIHSLHWVFFPISSLIVGRLTDKYGPKLPLMGGGILIGLGISLLSTVQNITQFYLFYSLASLGSGIIWALPTATVQRWFVKFRGLSIGIVASGVGMCYALSPLSSLLIANIGWRASYVVLGIGTCLILLVAGVLIISSPEEKGLEPYGAGQDGPVSGGPGFGGWDTADVMRNRNFWLICGIHASHLFAVMTLAVHLVIYATDVGISEVSAATAWFIVGLSSIAGRIVGGYSGETIGYKRGFIICGLANTVMLIWLMRVESLWMLFLFVPLYGFFYGAETPMLPGALGEYFGLKPIATLIGTMMLTGMLSGTIAPFFAGFMYDAFQSYMVPFGTASAFWAFSAFLASLLRKPEKPI